MLAEYTEEFREKVQEELADPGSGDGTELIYEDYEGDGEPNNMVDILMVYMVKHGFGDTATVMTEKNRRAFLRERHHKDRGSGDKNKGSTHHAPYQ